MLREVRRKGESFRPPAESEAGGDLAVIGRLLARATREIQPLAALTPQAAQLERERLVCDLAAGRAPVPRWTYAPRDHSDLRRALDDAERGLARADRGPVKGLYLGRVRELSVEAALCEAVGTPAVGALARKRFEPRSALAVHEASTLCQAWLAGPPPTEGPGGRLLSDDPSPESLLSRMRAAVDRLRLPFAVVAERALAPLAATGDGTIYVAAGRVLSREDAERTVLHEVEGHAAPRARARGAPVALFGVGTARGTDDQEGLALVIEERAGMLGPSRRRQLAARYRAVETMQAGADFVEVARVLSSAHGLSARDAVVTAERVFRGSDGTHPGLGRERVYLEALALVRQHLLFCPEDERVLRSGQVSVEAAATLRPFVDAGW